MMGRIKNNYKQASALAMLAVLAFSLIGPVTVSAATDQTISNHNQTVTAAETKAALLDAPGVLGSSDQVVTQTDADSAIVADAAGTKVDVPKNPEAGVTFGSESGTQIEIDLPNAEKAGDAKTVAPGVVAYDAGNGSASAVQATEDGGVRMLTVIDNPNAPTAYDYKVTVPNGGRIELTEDGGAIVLDSNNQPISAVGTPWAKDANETPVTTWFTTDGRTLTQHVAHNVPGVVYPVTADPFWIPAAAFGAVATAFIAAAKACGVGFLAGSAWQIFWNGWVWREVVKAGAQGCVEGMLVRAGVWGWAKFIIRR